MSLKQLTIFVENKQGTLVAITDTLAKHNVNIEDVSQTIMQGNFTMIMLVNLSNATVTLANLVEEANALGEEIGVKIILQHEDIFNTMYRV